MKGYLLLISAVLIFYAPVLYFLGRNAMYQKYLQRTALSAVVIAAAALVPACWMSGTNEYLNFKASPFDYIWMAKLLSILMLIFLEYTGLRLKKLQLVVPASILLLAAVVIQVTGIFDRYGLK